MTRTSSHVSSSALALALVGLGACSSEKVVVRTVSSYDGTTPVPGVAVQVNDQDWATTDANGEASFDKADAPFVVRTHRIRRGGSAPAGYRFDDISVVHRSESPAVVPVDGNGVAGVSLSGGWISGSVQGASGAAHTGVMVFADGAGPDLQGDVFGPLRLWWAGAAASHASIVRAFEFEVAPATIDVPAHYLAYGEANYTAAKASTIGGVGWVNEMTVALSPVTDTHVIASIVQPPALVDRLIVVDVYLMAPTADLGPGWYSALRLARHVATGAPGTIDIPFPVVSGLDRLLSLSAGGPEPVDVGSTTSGSAWSVRLDASASTVDLTGPTPVELLEPATDGPLTAATRFRWAPHPDGGALTLHAWCQGIDATGTTIRVSYRMVEGEGGEASLPVVPDLTLPSGAVCTAYVRWAPTACDNPGIRAWSDTRQLTVP